MSDLFPQRYYNSNELRDAGFKSIGENVRIHATCNIHGVSNIALGDNVRIDAYTTIIATGPIELGSYIHIGAYCLLSGGDGITLQDFSGLSHGVKIYSRSDDYSGESMTNPCVPPQYTNVIRGRVTLGRHVVIGSGSVVLPNVTIGEGSAIGALSLVAKDLPAWGIYFGNPVKRIRSRSQRLLELEREFLNAHAP